MLPVLIVWTLFVAQRMLVTGRSSQIRVLFENRKGRVRLWLSSATNTTRPVHLAIAAASEDEVRAFYAAALAAGADADGEPAMKFDGAGDYYGASVRDVEDRKIEAVFRAD